jgi:hypothetical protein
MAKEIMYTPFAPCMWAFLQEPKTDPEGEYEDAFQISLVLSHDTHGELLKQISELHKAAGGTAKVGEKGHPIKPHKTKNEDGTYTAIDNKYEVRFKTKAEYAPLAITTLDSQRKVIFREKNFVANGSVVSVAWSFGNYNNKGNKGVSLFLNAVQIKELIEWSGSFDVENSKFEEIQGYETGDTVDVAFPVDDKDISPEDLNGQDGQIGEETTDLPF